MEEWHVVARHLAMYLRSRGLECAILIIRNPQLAYEESIRHVESLLISDSPIIYIDIPWTFNSDAKDEEIRQRLIEMISEIASVFRQLSANTSPSTHTPGELLEETRRRICVPVFPKTRSYLFSGRTLEDVAEDTSANSWARIDRVGFLGVEAFVRGEGYDEADALNIRSSLVQGLSRLGLQVDDSMIHLHSLEGESAPRLWLFMVGDLGMVANQSEAVSRAVPLAQRSTNSARQLPTQNLLNK